MDMFKIYLGKLTNSGCPWTPKVYENSRTKTLYDGCSDSIDPDDLAFHPNGCCGCVVVPDDGIFGIRCDHLMWLVGEHENVGDDGWKPGVLLLGNHKGRLVIKFLYEE